VKNKRDTKIAILGMGYLMEYIYPCYENLLGDNIGKNIVAVTADEKDLPRKQKRCAFPVILEDNLSALRMNKPDYIFIAPPPKLAPEIVEKILVPYYKELRENGRTLPIIYAFPPNPVGAYYLEKLGSDVMVVNILPNMVSEIAGERLAGEGLTYITFADESKWTQEKRTFLSEFFAPLGGTIEVKPCHIMQMLAGTVAIHTISEIIFTITDAINHGEAKIDFKDIASAMRSYHRTKRSYQQSSCQCSKEKVDPYLYAMLKKVTFHWFEGVKEFYLDAGLDEETSNTILVSLLDLHLHVHQRENRNDIEAKTLQHATRGGVLEKGCQMFARLVKTGLEKEFSVYPDMKLTDAWCDWLESKAYQITRIISEHGSRLSTGKSCEPYTVKNHAITFGLIAQYTLETKAEGSENALSLAAIRYARERGGRMRQRCERFGDPVNMLSYKAYCEWQPEQEEMTAQTLQMSPVHKTEVTGCPWLRAWNENGFGEYSKYYCDFADFNLVKGFSDTLRLEMGKTLSRGNDACLFIWCGADMTPENAAWIHKRRSEIMDSITFGWEYHTAHLYYTMIKTIRTSLGSIAAEMEQKVRNAYADIFTEESLSVIDSYANTDFKIAKYNEKKQ